MAEEFVEFNTEPQLPSIDSGLGIRSKLITVIRILLLLLLLFGVVFAVYVMINNPAKTEAIRDIVIIFMAVESLLIGLVLIILMVQLARLTAVLQNEVKPILDSTNETLNTLRGTTTFISDKMVKPVIKVNSSIAALQRAIELLKLGR